MFRLFNKLRSSRGTSLLEVLIALSITGIITLAVFKAYLTQHQNYMTQEDITDIQQNARVVIDELSKQIRMAGNNLPFGLDAITASNTNPDTITLTYRIDNCDSYLSEAMPLPSSELKCGGDVSCFHDDQWAYIFHPDSGGGEWFYISHVQSGSKHIQHNTMSLSKVYDKDAIILSMQQLKFFVDNSDADHPKFMVQLPGQSPQLFAENIADIQFRYVLKNGSVVDVPPLVEDVREVVIGVTGQSQNPDYDSDDLSKRQRSYSTSVNVRNL